MRLLALPCLLYCLAQSAAVEVAEEEGVVLEEAMFADMLIIRNFEDLPLLNDHLADHWLLIQNTPECLEKADTAWSTLQPALRNPAKMEGFIYDAFFEKQYDCAAACLEKGTSFDHLPYVLSKYLYNSDQGDSFAQFLHNCQTVEAGWQSYLPRDALLYWVSSDGEERSNGLELPIGESNAVWQTTMMGHTFEVFMEPEEEGQEQEFIGTWRVEHNSFFVIGGIESRLQDLDVSHEVHQLFTQEWSRKKKVTRTFTEIGFAKGKLPKELYASMHTYYWNNRHNLAPEEWNSGGLHVNWWEADVYMTVMPHQLKRYWQSELKKLVEAWSGVELELTDIYGMRRYEDGARLLTHVDREETHAASLIINVVQGGIREPWHVEIYDFAERLHEITMDPGDIVYYESARCLHGRMKPLQGAFYVNLFAHYRPAGGDRTWYEKPIPAGSPQPLLDIGTCTVEGNTTKCTKNGDKVPYLSPEMQTLKGPQDLFKYWKRTTPARKEHSEL